MSKENIKLILKVVFFVVSIFSLIDTTNITRIMLAIIGLIEHIID